MRITDLSLPGLKLIEAAPHADARGAFRRLYCAQSFAEAGLRGFTPVQSNLSSNPRRRTLRGMHFQASPHAEAKLVQPIRGEVYDVALDLRPQSPSYMRWLGVELSPGRGLFIPEGCAHGFLTLSENADLLYHMGAAYTPEAARTVRWNDPAFQISWPHKPLQISDRDADAPDFNPSIHEASL